MHRSRSVHQDAAEDDSTEGGVKENQLIDVFACHTKEFYFTLCPKSGRSPESSRISWVSFLKTDFLVPSEIQLIRLNQKLILLQGPILSPNLMIRFKDLFFRQWKPLKC